MGVIFSLVGSVRLLVGVPVLRDSMTSRNSLKGFVAWSALVLHTIAWAASMA